MCDIHPMMQFHKEVQEVGGGGGQKLTLEFKKIINKNQVRPYKNIYILNVGTIGIEQEGSNLEIIMM